MFTILATIHHGRFGVETHNQRPLWSRLSLPTNSIRHRNRELSPSRRPGVSDISQVTRFPWRCYPNCAVVGKVFRLNLPDSSIFVGWRCPEAHSTNFVVIRTHLSRRFYLAVETANLGTVIPSECITCASWCLLSQLIMQIGLRSSMNAAIVRRPGCVTRTGGGSGHGYRLWSSLRRYGREVPGPHGYRGTTQRLCRE